MATGSASGRWRSRFRSPPAAAHYCGTDDKDREGFSIPQSPPSPNGPPLSALTLAALAAPSIALSALSLPLVVYLPSYYSGSLHLDLGVVGAVFMIVRIIDIVLDPLLGGWMDRTRTRFGRYRPWVAAGAPMIMVGMVMLFTASPGVGPGYLAIWLLVAYAGWSVLGLAQLALAAGASPDYQERSRIYAWWQFAFMLGMVAAMLIPKILAFAGRPGQTDAMHMMAWFVVGVTPLMTGFTLAIVPERHRAADSRHGGISTYFRLARRGDVRIVLLGELLLGLGAGATTTLAVFFFALAKGIAPADVGLILIGQFAVALLVTPVWTILAGRLGKHRALALAATGSGLAQIPLYLMPGGNLLVAIGVFSLVGLFYGAIAMLPRAMIADCADANRLDSAEDCTGLLFALLIGVWKVGQALSVGLLFMILDWIDFKPALDASNSVQALDRLQWLYCFIPLLLSGLAALLLLRYPLTSARHAEILQKLQLKQ
ncbi:MFS transporter [Sphingobium cupriresistens]|uniref:MFS transporter n=1 Tax=Sphingobium cupriresistens LL01 TaxID=1420583 RepID=A0A0J7XZX0_9SPHN|nr:MFS transporter [Sphingobium cupriresistens]KMS57042.1 MFS transporter [Sphingobium cupriresistens LL01]